MQIALMGLSQSGKSTLFSAITEGHVHAQAGAAHQADKAVVKVPDERLDKLSAIYKPKKTTQATIEFIDLPGLSFIDESNRQEARRIVAQARQADMLVEIIRDFHSDDVAAYRDRVDPAKDIDELKNELLLADLELIENRIAKLEVAITKPTPNVEQNKRELELMRRCREAAENLNPISAALKSPEEEKLVKSFGFLTMKPLLAVLNVDESRLGAPSPLTSEQTGTDVFSLSAKLESELAVLDVEERGVFMEDLGINEIARDRLIHTCYQTMNLASFLTVGPTDVRAWTVPAGCPALDAAGEIHSDIQRGFIRAETVTFDDFIDAGDMKAAKAAGKVRLEGKTYPVQDGDIITFRFNV
jgi:GTP-binding protein YchF